MVVSLGGSVLVPGERDPQYIKSLAKALLEVSRSYQVFVVTGGGRLARYYIETGRALGMDERGLDELGIAITRLNARLIIHAVGSKASPKVPRDYEEASRLAETYDIVVMGGQRVSITTDSVAAELAEAVGASRLVNATIVDGVYTADPRENPEASRINILSYDDLIRLTGEPTGMAGPSMVFDAYAARLVRESRIPVSVVQGRDLESLKAAIRGQDFVGTLIGDDH